MTGEDDNRISLDEAPAMMMGFSDVEEVETELDNDGNAVLRVDGQEMVSEDPGKVRMMFDFLSLGAGMEADTRIEGPEGEWNSDVAEALDGLTDDVYLDFFDPYEWVEPVPPNSRAEESYAVSPMPLDDINPAVLFNQLGYVTTQTGGEVEDLYILATSYDEDRLDNTVMMEGSEVRRKMDEHIVEEADLDEDEEYPVVKISHNDVEYGMEMMKQKLEDEAVNRVAAENLRDIVEYVHEDGEPGNAAGRAAREVKALLGDESVEGQRGLDYVARGDQREGRDLEEYQEIVSELRE